MLAALRASVKSHLKAGFKWVEGRLSREVAGKERIDAKPSALMASKSGDLDFNPVKDAFAVRMGARFVSDNHYYLRGDFFEDKDGKEVDGRIFVDRNGMVIDQSECPECGGNRWYVKRPFRPGTPGKRPWDYDLVPCRVCVSVEELDDARRRQEMYSTPKQRPVQAGRRSR